MQRNGFIKYALLTPLLSAVIAFTSLMPVSADVISANPSTPSTVEVTSNIASDEALTANSEDPTTDEQPSAEVAADVTQNLPAVAASVVTPNCVDGHDKNTLKVTWITPYSLIIGTKNDAILCSDVDFVFTSYILPATYDNSGSFNYGATPQHALDSTSVTLKAGTSGGAVMTVNHPDECTAYQTDIYYPPEVLDIIWDGVHQTEAQMIWGRIMPHTKTNCTPTPVPVVPGRGGDQPSEVSMPQTPVAVASAPVATPVSTPVPAATLTNTGTNSALPVILASLLLSAAAAIHLPASAFRRLSRHI